MERTAPAKINLSLRVLRRRDDGFHEIESLVCPLALHDVLEFAPSDSPGIHFSCDDRSLPTDDSNLVVRAARLFFAAAQLEPRVRIALRKHIPHGAGLGGGSSDAATTLAALNELFAAGLPLAQLAEIAAEIGSDVPLFLYRSAARVSGRGEQVEPVAFAPTLPLLLVKPGFGVPTPWAYRQWRESREIPGVPYGEQAFPWGVLVNDLERPVYEKYLLLAVVKRWFLAQPEVGGALMSGSGATTFAVLRSAELAAPLEARFVAEFGPEFWICRTSTAA